MGMKPPEETVGDWQKRKRAQARRFMERDPSLSLDRHGDYGTRFVLVHRGLGTALRFGQLYHPRTSDAVDLTDQEIELWAEPLRKARQ